MHLIFDFDGTLVDSFDKAIDKFNNLAEELNFRKIHSVEITKLKDLSSQELIKYLQIPMYKLPTVLYKARKHMNSKILTLSPCLNIRKVLQKFHDANFTFGILTSNSAENVTAWLDANEMTQFFNFIHVESNYFGKSRIIKKILKKYGINKSHAYYIGDETRDIDAARKNDIFSIAVTWGFNSEKILLQHQPHYIARRAEDLLKIFDLQP